MNYRSNRQIKRVKKKLKGLKEKGKKSYNFVKNKRKSFKSST